MAVAIRWWRANRPAAPSMPEDELRHAFALLADQPLIGEAERRAAGFVEVLRL